MRRSLQNALWSALKKMPQKKRFVQQPPRWTRNGKMQNIRFPLAIRFSLAWKPTPSSDMTKTPLYFLTRNSPCCLKTCHETYLNVDFERTLQTTILSKKWSKKAPKKQALICMPRTMLYISIIRSSESQKSRKEKYSFLTLHSFTLSFVLRIKRRQERKILPRYAVHGNYRAQSPRSCSFWSC